MNTQRYSVKIRAGERLVVSVDNYDVPQNQITFFFGESGIGKSMISKAVYGLLDPDELFVTINGTDYRDYLNDTVTKEIKKNSFFVFQEPSSHLNSLLKISEQLNEGSLTLSDAQSEIMAQLWQTADEQDINRLLNVYPKPYRPSGGEKQRILLAMAFKKIDVLLKSGNKNANSFFVFDEPTGSLDNRYRNLFLKLLIDTFRKQPFTIMIITHDYSIISEMQAQYHDIIDKIHYRELRRKDGAHVEVVDFSANEYLDWLSQSKQHHEIVPAGKNVLTMSPRFKVFGRNLCIYKDINHTVPVDLRICKGEMVYVKAPSGVGKTTLAKVILGLYQSQKANLNLSGMDITEKTPEKFWAHNIWGKKAGMVFQHADESLDLQSTVYETFAGLSLPFKLTIGGLKKYLLELFEMQTLTNAFLAKKVARLSGGQKQRLNLLRTLALGTDLIILDEPLNGLDFLSVKKVLAQLQTKLAQGSALLMISHNEEIFDAFVDEAHTYYLGEEN